MLPAPPVKATSDASDARAAAVRPVRDYSRPARQDHRDRGCIRPDCSLHPALQVHPDRATVAGPDAPDLYILDGLAPDSPASSASPVEAHQEQGAHPEPLDAY